MNQDCDDLSETALAAVVGPRSLRSYPATLSTEAMAMAWAREGAAAGSIVIADYQASPRGRGGLPWVVRAGQDLGFTLLLRPQLPPEREGWPYVTALLGLRDAVGGKLVWPDTIIGDDGQVLASLGVYVELGPGRTEWVTVNVLIPDATPRRAELLGAVTLAVEARMEQEAAHVLGDYLPLCTTIGQQRLARLIPMGPGGPEVTGEAVDVLADGALVLLTARDNRVAIPPQNLGLLEEPQGPVEAPERLFGQLSRTPRPT